MSQERRQAARFKCCQVHAAIKVSGPPAAPNECPCCGYLACVRADHNAGGGR